MGRLILFNGGTSGGIYIDSNGVQTLAPLATSVLMHLRAVADLVSSTRGLSPKAKASKDLQALITKISNLAVDRVEAAVGPLDAADSLVYLDDGDGFVCGSTGAPPRPIGWPPAGPISVEDLVERGALASDVIEFLQRTQAKGLKVADVLNDPASAAKTVGVQLSELAIANLKPLAPSQLDKIRNPVDRSVVAFFHKVVADGRFLDSWNREPAAVAKALGVEVDLVVIDKILGTNAIVGRASEVANLSIQQGIVVGIVAILVLRTEPGVDSVIDLSRKTKF